MMGARRVPARLRRGAYLLPSLFTVGNMFLGFLALMRGLTAEFTDAALLIYAAAVLDSLDGRIARRMGTESEFGKELDSLADVLTFGMVPALLAYHWGLAHLGRAGWLVPFFYLVCAATRLARFNVQTKLSDGRSFVGLPSPAAAGGIAAVLFFAPDSEWRGYLTGLMVVALAGLGSLMVSTFRYPSFKKLDPGARLSFRVLVPVAAVLLVAALEPRAFFLVAASVYTFSGPLAWVWSKIGPKRPAAATPRDSVDEEPR